MSIDPQKINVVSSKKVQYEDLTSWIEKEKQSKMHKLANDDKKCNACCMGYGALIGCVSSFLVNIALVGSAVYFQKFTNYSLQGFARQVLWLCAPCILMTSTLHFFLSEAMWSGRRNSWGQAWTKAFAFNTVMWSAGVGTGTLLWRYIMPRFRAGRRLFYRYPIPTSPLLFRVINNEDQVVRGMDWSYWLLSVMTAHLNYVTIFLVTAYNDRAYMLMPPNSGYAKKCMPPWRRLQITERMSRPLQSTLNDKHK